MGWKFHLEYTNIAAYLTAPGDPLAPRMTKWQLKDCLGSLSGEKRERPPLISNEPEWIRIIVEKARAAFN